MFPVILYDFVAIDFETAHSRVPCQIGIAVVEKGEITETRSFLIQPPDNEYSPYTIKIHGITPDMTANAPLFPEVWEQIKPYIENRVIVAHNLQFDLSVLIESLKYYDIPQPRIAGLIDSMGFCGNESLSNACRHYGIIIDHHHDGECDARCCAELMLAVMFGNSCTDSAENDYESNRQYSKKESAYKDYEYHAPIDKSAMKQDLTNANPDNPFYNKKVVITGVFRQDRNELAHIIQSMGAKINANISTQTNYVIIGEAPGPAKMDKMNALIEEGWGIKEIYQDELDEILSKYN